ncbi:TfoX/Sxy family protein [Candidatus Kapabacteria bacterium]|nr:TfoX/Sxy family protein [Candidatus Kapabacteria bacterium]
MALNGEFKNFVLDQLQGIGEFETKLMFGGLALISKGSAFAKIKHDKFWLKVNESNLADFENFGMSQYTYGKDNSRKLNFYETPVDVIEDRDRLKEWVKKSIEIALIK